MASKAELTRQVKVALSNPYELANVLGLVNARSQKQARGVIVNCPAHDDTGRPNCSITKAKDGTAQVKCHACGFSGDAITLVAVVHGLDLSKEFKRTLRLAAELAGQHALADEIGDGKPRPDRIHLPEPRQLPEAPWPEHALKLWQNSAPLHTNHEAVTLLDRRGIDSARVERLNLMRSIQPGTTLPYWASFGRRSWLDTGHTMIARAFDSDGALRSVRAWRTVENDTPKRLPPSGCKAAGLVLADRLGWRVLSGHENHPSILWIVEGEPDWLATSLAAPGGHGVIGIGSGSWTKDHAKKIRQVHITMVATHPDEAGDRYASEILADIPRAIRWRPPKDLDECGQDLQALLGSASKWLRIPHALGD